MRPPTPPIVHHLERRRADRMGDRGEFDLMFWACVVVATARLYALLTWGGR